MPRGGAKSYMQQMKEDMLKERGGETEQAWVTLRILTAIHYQRLLRRKLKLKRKPLD